MNSESNDIIENDVIEVPRRSRDRSQSQVRPTAAAQPKRSEATDRALPEGYTSRARTRTAQTGAAKTASTGSAASKAQSAGNSRSTGGSATGSSARTTGGSNARSTTGSADTSAQPNRYGYRVSSGYRGMQPRTMTTARSRSRARNPRWATVVVTICVILLLGVGCISIGQIGGYMEYRHKCELLNQNTFYEGVTLDGESLAGLTYDQALARYKSKYDGVSQSTQITVTALGKSYAFDSGSVQMSTNIQSTLTLAYSQGRSGSMEERYARIQQLSQEGMNFSLSHSWNEQTLRTRIQELASAINVKGRDADVASFDPEEGTFTFSEGVTGYELDTGDLYTRITEAIATENVNATIDARVTVTEPKYTAAWLRDHFGRISFAQTKTSDDDNRNANIKLAASQFNGMRVEPGQTVSFNGTTGERTASKGYKAAGAYSNDILIQEDGGGVCQVSTTLYNAVAKADLEIVERSNHKHVSSYIGIGLDAAVNWPSQDFKFKNNTEFPIFISANYADRHVTFKIYGKQMDDGVYIMLDSKQTEELEPEEGVVEKPDGQLPVGLTKKVDAVVGAKAESYKIYYDANNNEIKRELLAKSTYPSQPEYLRVGTGTDLPS